MNGRIWTLALGISVPMVLGCGGDTPKPGQPLDPTTDGVSVLQHHHSAMRNGAYEDAALTRQAAASVHRVQGFDAPVNGSVYAQPLFLEGADGSPDLVLVAT
jgi:hypothetical protein